MHHQVASRFESLQDERCLALRDLKKVTHRLVVHAAELVGVPEHQAALRLFREPALTRVRRLRTQERLDTAGTVSASPANRPFVPEPSPGQNPSSWSSGAMRAAARARWEIRFLASADHCPSVRPPGGSCAGSKMGS